MIKTEQERRILTQKVRGRYRPSYVSYDGRVHTRRAVLHLIKLNIFVYGIALVVAAVTMILVGASFERFGLRTFTIASVLGSITLAIVYFGWKLIPGFSRWVFPNISGAWSGKIRFKRNGVDEELDAELDVEQDLHHISLVLNTDAAESETIVVYPRKLSNRRFELLYVYQTRSKPSTPPPSYHYRGTAELRIEDGRTRMVGNYYTEQGGLGIVEFQKTRRPSAPSGRLPEDDGMRVLLGSWRPRSRPLRYGPP